jgi:uncharacterized protein DUF3558
MRYRPRWLAGLTALLGLVLLSVVSVGTAWAAVRPAAAASPCALLTSAQLHQLRVNPGTERSTGPGAPSCVWEGRTQPWGGEYVGALINGPTPGGNPAPAINGRPTSEYLPPGLDSRYYCVYLVSVAPDRTLWAQYGSPGGNQPGLNHRVACRNAQALASYLASTVGTLPR